MNKKEKKNLTDLGRLKEFSNILEKLITDKELLEKEKIYILSSAIIFSKYYEKDKRFSSYIEFAYYIILVYSIRYNDYKPLYDFSINFGFYPIAQSIIDNYLIKNIKINDYIISSKIQNYKNENYIETLEQRERRLEILKKEDQEVCYIAPTSYGKSSIIVEHIKKNEQNKKIGIIVPTKSLLMQTYRLIKGSNLKRKILINDEMYQEEKSFIAVFTQERALRLLDKNKTYFDILFIDEAHNIFNKSARNILLTRVIKKAKILNNNLKLLYLSPLINNVNNLKIETIQNIKEQRIYFNIKEPAIFEYRLNKEIYKYNRFLNLYYKLGEASNEIDYIQKNSENKNFVYIRAPKKIEKFANDLYLEINFFVESNKVNELIELLKENVHQDFYAIKLLRKGIVYLHGKLPDLVKEYLEYKYNNLSELKYLIANTVILEGMNLPIDTLFILNTYNLKSKELNNLIGRVNRLNNIFLIGENNLKKLLPKIHFVNSEEFNRKKSNMKNKINCLRSKVFEDQLDNPTLELFELDKIKDNKEKERISKIIEDEKFIIQENYEERDSLKMYLIKEGLNKIYDDFDNGLSVLDEKINCFKTNIEFKELKIIDKIYRLFIEDVDQITDYEIKRLSEIKARNFYDKYIYNYHNKTLKENINSMYLFFKDKIEDDDFYFYIGESYGEIEKRTSVYDTFLKKVYVDLSKKTNEELINLAIIKLELENKFISYKLNKFVIMMYDYKLITEEEYNIYIYGTTEKRKINLTKLGISMSLISRLESAGQLENIYVDEFNNLASKPEFFRYKKTLNDFQKFEIDRYL